MLKTLPDYKFQKFEKGSKKFILSKDPELMSLGSSEFENMLSKYKNKDYEDDYIFLKTDDYVVIYDKYPKSFIHLLVLPYEFYYVSKDGKKVCADNVSEFRSRHAESIRKLHNFCKLLEIMIQQKYKDFKFELIMGYHTNPSMKDLHVHIMSNDFMYVVKEYRKKYYTDPKHFISIDNVSENFCK